PFREYTGYSWYLKLFECIKQNSEFMITLFKAGFKEKYLSVVNRLVLHDADIPTTKKYLRIIWTGGIVNTIIYWLENDMAETVEEISTFCFDNMSVYSE
ncbi:MAG: TetR-like C-terminal domain-containing protein, partial [Candidatus Neoclostridium sp.]